VVERIFPGGSPSLPAAAGTSELGPVDILVNNAGLPAPDQLRLERFHDSTPASWEPWIRLNFYGVLHACHAVIGGMRERAFGRVITIVSNAGRVGDRSLAVYGAAKAAAMGFSRCLALENANRGITCNCVSLGTVLAGEIDAAHRERLLAGYPVGRLGRPGDVAPVVVFLASDAASWVTAQTWVVDGGNAPS
jgi:3-oxoacyl-[acyl-carrier protein] reductase